MLTKKQVKAILEVLKTSDRSSRSGITYLQVDTYQGRTVLVCTDSYTLSAINADIDTNHIGQGVPLYKLERWYKLASNRDTFEVMAEDLENNAAFPKWQGILDNATPTDVGYVSFSADLAKRLETIAGSNLTFCLTGPLSPMVSQTNNGTFVLMPLKLDNTQVWKPTAKELKTA